jgi:hypothetical protein
VGIKINERAPISKAPVQKAKKVKVRSEVQDVIQISFTMPYKLFQYTDITNAVKSINVCRPAHCKWPKIIPIDALAEKLINSEKLISKKAERLGDDIEWRIEGNHIRTSRLQP